MKGKKSFIWLFLLLSGSVLTAQEKILSVIPEPQQYQFTSKNFLLDESEILIRQYCGDYELVNLALAELNDVLESCFNITLQNNQELKKQIIIGLPDENKKFNSICSHFNLTADEKLGDEGYKLLILPDTILITANNQKGLFYGLQTLKQIIRGADSKSFLPGLIITDYPSLNIRAVMDDISRGPVPTIDFMKYQIRRLAEMKINMFTHYVEHVVKTKSHPEFAPKEGSITIDEWKELSDYAKKYNITLVGSFQSFGHFNNILAVPEYSHLGESGTLISPVNPESYKFLEDIYSEMIPAFKAPFFNINCDETFDLGKGTSKTIVDSLGYAEVYFQHIIKLHDVASKLNSKILMWGDVLLEHPELLRKLPKDIVVATWTYDDLDSYSKFIDPIKAEGLQFLVAPGVLNSSRLFPLFKQTFGNIKGFANAAVKSNALGALTTIWDDGGNAFFSNDWYGVSYAADKSWNCSTSDSVNYDYRFNKGIYGTSDDYLTEAVWKLNELADLEPTDGMNDKVLFEKLIPEKGKQIKISTIDWKKVFEISSEAESFAGKGRLKNYAQDQKYILYACRLYQTLAKERFDLLNAVKFYSYADSLQKINPAETKNYLFKAVDLIDGIIRKEELLKSDLTKLWLNENQLYALDRLTNNYQNKINDFKDVKTNISESIKKVENSLPMLSKEEARLGISQLPGKYFREWLMINPLPNKDKLHLSQIDYLTEMGGEKNAAPKVTQEFLFDSVKYRWSRVTTQYQDILNLSEIFEKKNKDAVVYAFATIESKKDTTVNALIGFDEGIEVLINGSSIFKMENDGEIIADQFRFSLPLRKGNNNLMIKSSQTKGAWGFSFRLPDSEVRNRKNKYRIISE